jgi:ADP-ribose pyrophosphatase YjhB (NUDIX family)
MEDPNKRIFEIARRMEAMAMVGIQFGTGYDLERSEETRALALELLALSSFHTTKNYDVLLPLRPDYPTAKVDIRAIVFNSVGQLLMVQERSDTCWTPPGGWADIGYTPAQVAIKETREEAGLDVTPTHVMAIFDKSGFEHPPHVFHTYKVFLFCTLNDQKIQEPLAGHEVLAAAWFSPNQLPELSLERITLSQLDFIFTWFANGYSELPSNVLFN